MKVKKAIIWVDGASRNNPGPAAIGAVIKDEQGRVHARLSQCIGIAVFTFRSEAVRIKSHGVI